MMKRQTTPTPPANLSGIDWDQMPEVDPTQVDQDLALMQALPASAGEPMDPMFDSAEQASVDLTPGRGLYVHVARGSITANGTALQAGDALKWWDAGPLTLANGGQAEVLVFDLPLP